MQLTIGNTSGVGQPVRVFDARGAEIPYCTFCDTETGAVTRIKTIDGKFCVAGRELKYISEVRPAPLKVEPIK